MSFGSKILHQCISFLLMLLIVLISLDHIVLANAVEKGFNKREKFKNSTKLGDPNASKILDDRHKDTSNLQNFNDSDLVNAGAKKKHNSRGGVLLEQANVKTQNAMSQYKIGPDTKWLNDSLKTEQNPLAKTGGTAPSSSEHVEIIETKKSCTEGVDFNVDVNLELALQAEEEEYFVTKETKEITVPYSDYGHLVKPEGSYGWDIYPFIRRNIESKLGNPNLRVEILNNTFVRFEKHKPFFPGWKVISVLGGGVIVRYNIRESFKKLVEKGEAWVITSTGPQKLIESNECYETGRVCLKQGKKTFFNKYEVERPCWNQKISYRCTSEPKNGCAYLTKRGCKLIDSECEEKIGPICMRWKRNYLCTSQKKIRRAGSGGSSIYCLGGGCHTPSIEENKDFANVAYLAALKDAKDDCAKDETNKGLCKDPITIFPGKEEGCENVIASIVNCCTSMKGWGKDLGLCRCTGEEKALAIKRDKGLCQEVGTYCSQKLLGMCVVRTTNFCCFNSKLAKVFQKGAREQIPGMDWGDSENPNCRAMTLHEFTQLDFSKFDMEELYDAVLSKGKDNMHKKFPTMPKETNTIIPRDNKQNSVNTKALESGNM